MHAEISDLLPGSILMWTNFFYNNYNNISDDEGSEDYFTADETEDIQCQLFDFVTWLSDDGTVWILPADFFNNNISLHNINSQVVVILS